MGNVIKKLADDTVVDMLTNSEERARLIRVARFLVPDAELEPDEYDHYDLANLPEDELRCLVAEEVGEGYVPPKDSEDAQVGGQWSFPLTSMMATAAAAAVACVVVLPPNLPATNWLISGKHTEKLHVSAPPVGSSVADGIGFDLFPSEGFTEKIESVVAKYMSDSLERPAVIGHNMAYPASLGNDRTGLLLPLQFGEQDKVRRWPRAGIMENGYSVVAYYSKPGYNVGTSKPKQVRNGLTWMHLWNEQAQIDKIPFEAGSFETRLAAASGADLVDDLKGDRPFTVFTSTDEAFAAMPEGTVVNLFKAKNKDQLISALSYHVGPSKVMWPDLSGAMIAATLQGSEITLDLDDGVMINDANVKSADVEASDPLPTGCGSSEFSRFSELGDR